MMNKTDTLGFHVVHETGLHVILTWRLSTLDRKTVSPIYAP